MLKSRILKRVTNTVVVAVLSGLLAACETLELAPPVHGIPQTTINSTDLERVRSAIVSGMIKKGYSLDYNSGALVLVSRPLPKLQVLLLTESIPDAADRQMDTFDVTQGDQSIRVLVRSVKQMKLPGGAFNNDPLIDAKEFAEFQDFLNGLKREIEHGRGPCDISTFWSHKMTSYGGDPSL
jgi:hypothetical protein